MDNGRWPEPGEFWGRRRVCVTGGAGFLGSHLCERLLDDGHEVLCVDNLYTGSKKNIIPLLRNPYFDFLRHDITFPLYVEVDGIYNLASNKKIEPGGKLQLL